MKTFLMTTLTVLVIHFCFGQNKPISSAEITAKIVTLTEANIYNPTLLQTQAWKTFEKFLRSDAMKKRTGKDYVKAFNEASERLPFSHYYLHYAASTKNTEMKQNPFELEKINEKTVLLKIRKFVPNASAMVSIVQEIETKGYSNLIIDLRNNGGGSLDAAVVLGRYITSNPIDAGTYITRKWYDLNPNVPTKTDIQNFTYMQDMSLEGFRKIQEEPAFRMVLPGHNGKTFSGNVFVLTNSNTASACEPFVHVLKTRTEATIVGETTAGAMLSAVWFNVHEDLSLFIPTNDFITAEGIRLDKVGVIPHIEVPSEMALDEVLKKINAE